MRFIGYTAASCLAFLFDVSLLLLLSDRWLPNPAMRAALAFMGGLALNFLMCRHLVFRQARSGRADVQFVGFLLTGLAGLALTVLAVHVLVSIAGLSLLVSKLGAAAVVLVLNYGARARFVFQRA
jgi:putative flippase GtrA